ncbi:MAG: hypothetical protein KDA92_16470 [Planctomycetales bacterium]|nr:hypothetical protein [Planctomycetales bacterium]MCA9170808.1 hypothetical protein [Planctomycetales bacterium]
MVVQVLPVIDLLRGQVVHGKAGQRHLYQPVQSSLTRSARPVDVARAFRDQLGLTELYVADLDAIQHGEPAWADYDTILAECTRLWLDAGICQLGRAETLIERYGAAIDIVVGLETLQSRDQLSALLAAVGPTRIVVSLDLMAGQPRTQVAEWQRQSPTRIAADLAALGVRRSILLDIGQVGTGQGTGTRQLTRTLRAAHPDWQLTTGGGVATYEDLLDLAADGVDAVLLASTLHDGRIGVSELANLKAAATAVTPPTLGASWPETP